MNKKQLIVISICIVFILFVWEAYAQSVHVKDSNIYIKNNEGKETQLTFQGKDYSAKLSPDGNQIIFIRKVKEDLYKNSDSWYPSDCYEIWSMNTDGSNQHCIVRGNYSGKADMQYYLGSFDSLNFSPDGKRIYFLCQNCVVDAILYIADRDGNNIRRIRNAHYLSIVGGSPKDEYYGYLVAGVRNPPEGAVSIEWDAVLMDPDGKEIKKIDDLDKFWLQHKKYTVDPWLDS